MRNPVVPPPVVTAIAAAGMWLTDRLVNLGRVDSALLDDLAIAALVAGFLLMLGPAIAFWRAKTTINPLRPHKASSLVTGGVFRFSRNPIYLGDALVLVACGLWLGQWVNLVWLAAFIAFMNRFQISFEEAALAKLFGDEYADYCRRVRRWI